MRPTNNISSGRAKPARAPSTPSSILDTLQLNAHRFTMVLTAAVLLLAHLQAAHPARGALSRM